MEAVEAKVAVEVDCMSPRQRGGTVEEQMQCERQGV